MVLNAYDASAVEEALVLTEQHGGEVEVVLIGPDKAKETIRKALAMGASRGHHIHVEDSTGLDSAAFAEILTAFFEKNSCDVIATGQTVTGYRQRSGGRYAGRASESALRRQRSRTAY